LWDGVEADLALVLFARFLASHKLVAIITIAAIPRIQYIHGIPLVEGLEDAASGVLPGLEPELWLFPVLAPPVPVVVSEFDPEFEPVSAALGVVGLTR